MEKLSNWGDILLIHSQNEPLTNKVTTKWKLYQTEHISNWYAFKCIHFQADPTFKLVTFKMGPISIEGGYYQNTKISYCAKVEWHHYQMVPQLYGTPWANSALQPKGSPEE